MKSTLAKSFTTVHSNVRSLFLILLPATRLKASTKTDCSVLLFLKRKRQRRNSQKKLKFLKRTSGTGRAIPACFCLTGFFFAADSQIILKSVFIIHHAV